MYEGVLSKKFGGEVAVRTYCLFFYKRPPKLASTLLCSGKELWPPCSDFDLCRNIKAGTGVDRDRKGYMVLKTGTKKGPKAQKKGALKSA